MKVIVTAPRPNPKIRPPTSNASPILVGRSAASDCGPLLELVAEVGALVDLLEELRGPDPLDDRRQVLDQVPHRADERADEQVRERGRGTPSRRARRASPRCRAACRPAPRAT